MSHHHKKPLIPFTAIIGQDQMKKALVLNAINPTNGGVLIRGEKGTANSTAVRSLAELVPLYNGSSRVPVCLGSHTKNMKWVKSSRTKKL